MSEDKSLQAMTDKKKDRSADRALIFERQAVAAFKEASLEALIHNIIPIEVASTDSLYSERFTEKNIYHPLLLLGELKTLDRRKGGDVWLTGERLVYIRDKKLYRKEYGRETFEDFFMDDLDMSKASVYRCIAVYEKFTYSQSIKLGSKLYLIRSNFTDKEQKEAFELIADPKITYREAERLINQIKDKEEAWK